MKGREGTQTTRVRHNPKKGILGCSQAHPRSHHSVPSHSDARASKARRSDAYVYAPCKSNDQ